MLGRFWTAAAVPRSPRLWFWRAELLRLFRYLPVRRPGEPKRKNYGMAANVSAAWAANGPLPIFGAPSPPPCRMGLSKAKTSWIHSFLNWREEPINLVSDA